MKNHSTYISAKFCFFVKVIKKLETSNLTIIESLSIVENAENKLNEVLREISVIIINELNYILYKNVGLHEI